MGVDCIQELVQGVFLLVLKMAKPMQKSEGGAI